MSDPHPEQPSPPQPSDTEEHNVASPHDVSAQAAETGLGSRPPSEVKDSLPTRLLRRRLFGAALYLLDVLGTALTYLKLPLAVLLALVIGRICLTALVHILVTAVQVVLISLYQSSAQSARGSIESIFSFADDAKDALRDFFHATALSSEGVLCALPLLALCDAKPDNIIGTTVLQPDYPTLMDVQGRAFDLLLSQSETGIAISLDIKHAEIALRDLVAVVRASDLVNKDLITSALDDFVLDSRIAGRALQKLSVKIYSSTDNVIAFNNYVLRSLEAADVSRTSEVTASLTRVFYSSTAGLANEFTDILIEAAKTITSLDVLENQLVRIHAASIEDKVLASTGLDDVLSELWTKLGGNGHRLRDLERRSEVLENLDSYRRLAVAHVAATVQTLVRIEEELNQIIRTLRRIDGNTNFNHPLGVNIASIGGGIGRLREILKMKISSDYEARWRTLDT